jgi:flagellar biosynthetic protein FlhB
VAEGGGNDSSQEKTEEPTPKRLQKAKEEGQIARSKELSTALILILGVASLLIFGSGMAQSLMGIMSYNFSLERAAIFDPSLMLTHLMASAASALEMLFPLLLSLLIASFVAPSMLGGILFSSKALQPKFNRLNPLSGLKRMFSMNSLVELFKAIGKFVLVGSAALLILYHFKGALMSLAGSALRESIGDAMYIIGWSVLGLSAALIFIVAIDVPYQLFDHKKKLKMSMQEIKDEMKDTEGKPEVKSKIRQTQYDMAQRRMMEAVPEADVVITNPEHFSVALKYDVDSGGAPVVVAKGVDHLAIKIREIANAHEILIMEAPPLARAIYFTTELDQEIPGDLYLAVAQVLAYVFQLKSYRKGEGAKPKDFEDMELPDGMQYGVDGRVIKPEPDV